MADPFPAIPEAKASGVLADLFADIRATVGVRVVNLVWRHLATIDEALPWAWSAVKPLYLLGMADRAVVKFREGMQIPQLGALTEPQPQSVDDVLASYDHSNTVNLFTLGALVAKLRGDLAPEGVPEEGPRIPAPDVGLPMLASEGDVAPETWATVLRLNRFGDPEQVILASMYRHLAHAPAFLHRLEAVLAPVERSGLLLQAIEKNRQQAYDKAKLLARGIVAPTPKNASTIEHSLSLFVDHAIGKMVTICRAIRVARGGLSNQNV